MTDRAVQPEAPLVDHWLLDDIADRDAQTKPITKPEDLPLGRDGTKYDHARWQASEYHLDTHSLALGDRHLLLKEVRRLARAASQERPQPDERVMHSEAMAGPCPGGCNCTLWSPDADPADCGCDSYCTMDTTDWPKWSADAPGVAQERPQPDRDPIHAHHDDDDERPEVAQERPPIDVAVLAQAIRESGDPHDPIAVAEAYARLAGGSVASPEPPE
jgi:hypothetical protein